MKPFWPWYKPQPEPEAETFDTPAPTVPDAVGQLEPTSETWLFIQNYATTQIQTLREKNDLAKWDAVQTAEIRGQIKALKKLIALGEPKADKTRSVEDD